MKKVFQKVFETLRQEAIIRMSDDNRLILLTLLIALIIIIYNFANKEHFKFIQILITIIFLGIYDVLNRFVFTDWLVAKMESMDDISFKFLLLISLIGYGGVIISGLILSIFTKFSIKNFISGNLIYLFFVYLHNIGTVEFVDEFPISFVVKSLIIGVIVTLLLANISFFLGKKIQEQ